MMLAHARYDRLTHGTEFLDTAVDCSELTLPYLIRDDLDGPYHKRLITPWQSIGLKPLLTLVLNWSISHPKLHFQVTN